MENFNVGEVVWAKIRGYPWWPGYIRGIEDDNKEKKFVVQFIGDNTFRIFLRSNWENLRKSMKFIRIRKKRI